MCVFSSAKITLVIPCITGFVHILVHMQYNMFIRVEHSLDISYLWLTFIMTLTHPCELRHLLLYAPTLSGERLKLLILLHTYIFTIGIGNVQTLRYNGYIIRMWHMINEVHHMLFSHARDSYLGFVIIW